MIIGTDARRLVARPVLWASRDGTSGRRSDGPVSEDGLQADVSAAAFMGDELLVLGELVPGVALWSVGRPFRGL